MQGAWHVHRSRHGWGAANPIYDFDGSGTVDVADLTLVAGRWHR